MSPVNVVMVSNFWGCPTHSGLEHCPRRMQRLATMNYLSLILKIVITFIVLSFAESSLQNIHDEYDHSLYLDENEKYQLFWKVDNDKGVISFATIVNTTGWVGLGIAKGLSGKMSGADIAIGYVLPDGTGHLVDRYATGEVLPVRDDQQDYHLTGSIEKDGQTILKFHREIETCDEKDNIIKTGTTKLIFAYGEKDPNPNDEATILYHTVHSRGSRSINLLNYAKRTSNNTVNKYIDLKVNNVKIPQKDTVYWCSTFKITRNQIGGGKRHIVNISPVIQNGNEGIVHHLVIYDCTNMLNESHLGISFECESPNMPPEQYATACRSQSIIYVWAIGGASFVLPDVAGLPIGEHENAYYLIEMHYDNPQIIGGLVDSSGLRFYYTEDLRQYDASTLVSGIVVNQNHIIPPGQREWVDTAYCFPQCSKNIKEINVFASFPHMHTAGSALVTRLVRNGKEISEIIRNDNYDFNYQQTYMLPEEIIIKGGDTLVTKCTYNTVGRKVPTFGGFPSSSEMCLSFLLYYPKIDLLKCSTNNSNIGKDFSSKYAKKEGHKYNWNNVTWTEEMTQEMKKLQKNPISYSLCEFTHGSQNKTRFLEYLPKPVIKEHLPEPKSKCQGEFSSGNSQFQASLFTAFSTIIISLFLFVVNLEM